MNRGIAHALGILALAALGVLIQLTIEEPWPIAGQLGAGAWVWGAAGVVCALGCAVAAVAAGAGWRPRPVLVLALPSALLVAAGAVLFVGVGQVLVIYDDILAGRLYEIRWEQLAWRGTFVWMEASLAAMWAGIGFASAAAAFRALGNTAAGLALVDAAWLLLPLTPWVLVLLVLPSAFRALQVVGQTAPGEEDGGRRTGLVLAAMVGMAAAAAIGIVATGRTAGLHHIIAARSAQTASALQAFLAAPYVNGFRVGHAAVPAAGAFGVALGGLALLLLVTGRPRIRATVVPLVFVGLALLVSFGLRVGATLRVVADFGPICEESCTDLDRVTALLRGAEAQRRDQLRVDPCAFASEWDLAAADLRLPRVPEGECPEVGTVLRVGREIIDIGGSQWSVSALDDPRVDGRNAGRFDAQLRDHRETEEAIIIRNPSQGPHPVLILSIDASHPWATVERVRELAGAAGWCDMEFIVNDPGFQEPESPRRFGVGVPPATSIRPEFIHGRQITADGKHLVTSAGASHSIRASQPALDPAIQRLRPASSGSTLVVCPAPDRSLEEVLRVRQSLVPAFDRVILDPTCDQVRLGGVPGSFCERIEASGGAAGPEGGELSP